MKILITGASGFLGCRIARFLQFSHKVISLSSKELDITDAERVMDAMMEHCPKAVIHCAAIADTAYCAAHEADSFVVNVEGSINVAKACLAIGAKLIYMSSEQVYHAEGGDQPHREDALLHPTTVYARHKLMMEQAVQEILPTAVGLRLSWMYDLPTSPLRQNEGLLVKLQRAIQTKEPLKVPTRELRGITDVWEVVRRIEATIQLPSGIYNFGSTAIHSTFEVYKEALRLLLLREENTLNPENLLLADETWTRNLSMHLGRIREHGLTFPESLTQISDLLRRN